MIQSHSRLAHPALFALVACAIVVTSARHPQGAEPAPVSLAPLPVGSIVAFAGPHSAVPESSGWLFCDGREVATTAYPELFRAIGNAWGKGAPNSFLLPDLRGRFLRGVNHEAQGPLRDPDASARISSAPGGNAGNEVGSGQDDSVGPHQHPLKGVGDAVGQGNAGEFVRFHASKVPDADAPLLDNTWAIQPNTTSESRPKNVSVNWIIRAR